MSVNGVAMPFRPEHVRVVWQVLRHHRQVYMRMTSIDDHRVAEPKSATSLTGPNGRAVAGRNRPEWHRSSWSDVPQADRRCPFRACRWCLGTTSRGQCQSCFADVDGHKSKTPPRNSGTGQVRCIAIMPILDLRRNTMQDPFIP